MELGIYWFQISRTIISLTLLVGVSWFFWNKKYKLGGILALALLLVALYNPFRLQVYEQSEREIRSFDKTHEVQEIERHEVDNYQPEDNESDINRITGG